MGYLSVLLEQCLQWDKQATLFINGSDNVFWDEVIYVATSTGIWIPMGCVMLWVLGKNLSLRQFVFAVLFLSLAVLVSDQLSSAVFKPYFQRWRPTQDPLIMHVVDVVHAYRGGSYGFFSAHASNTFSVAVFLSLLFRRRLLGLLVVSWAVINSYTRIYLGVHYLGDVLVGTLFGLLIGSSMYGLYRKYILQGGVMQWKSSLYPHTMAIAILFSYCMVFIVALLTMGA